MKLNRIRAVLEDNGISQTWLAKKLGRSFSTVNAYVCNRSQPNLTTLLEIAQLLSVDMKELITTKRSVMIRAIMNKIYPIDERLFMRKLLIIYFAVIILLVAVYAIFALNAYISIKYEVETIDNDNIIGMIYQIFDVGVIVNFIGLVINMLIIGGLYMKFRSKHE